MSHQLPPQISFDDSLTPDGEALLKELTELLENDRAEEVLLSDWLHDETLPMPSRELISYIAFRLLTGRITETVSSLDRVEAAKEVIRTFRDESEEQRRESIERVRRHLECLNYLQSGKKGSYNPRTAEWQPVIDAFLFPFDPRYNNQAAGVRSLSRGILEAMVFRAIMCDDVSGIEGLASAMRITRSQDYPTPPHARRIAGEVIRFTPWLTEKLNRQPSKEEFKAFLRDVYPDELPPEWDQPFSDAYKLLNYHGPNDKVGRMDRDLIASLALKARKLV